MHSTREAAAADLSEPFDVFLCHNSKEMSSVLELAQKLKALGLKVWLDEWELVPGHPWQEAQEKAIKTSNSAAVLIGNDGLGPWQDVEMRASLEQFVKRKLPVIPVLLPGVHNKPELPVFLQAFTWVDLRGNLTPDGLARLVWGITGQKPSRAIAQAQNDSKPIRVGRWTLGDLLGEGGYGRVYVGTTGKESAAIKICNKDSEHARERFRNGADTLATLGVHKNIVQLLEGPCQEPDSILWYAMELVEGGRTLRDLRKAIVETPVVERLKVYRQVLRAVRHAHHELDRSIFHRDLTPENVLIDQSSGSWRAVVCDFDLARDERIDTLTHTQILPGKHYYVPPEQHTLWQGGDAYHWSRPEESARDLWAVGMLLLFVLTGHENTSQGVRDTLLRRHVQDISPESHTQLRDLVNKMLNDDPAKRLFSVKDVDAWVQSVLDAAKVVEDVEPEFVGLRVATKPSFLYRRAPAVRALAVTLLAAALAVAIFYLTMQPEPLSNTLAVTFEGSGTVAQRLRKDGLLTQGRETGGSFDALNHLVGAWSQNPTTLAGVSVDPLPPSLSDYLRDDTLRVVLYRVTIDRGDKLQAVVFVSEEQPLPSVCGKEVASRLAGRPAAITVADLNTCIDRCSENPDCVLRAPTPAKAAGAKLPTEGSATWWLLDNAGVHVPKEVGASNGLYPDIYRHPPKAHESSAWIALGSSLLHHGRIKEDRNAYLFTLKNPAGKGELTRDLSIYGRLPRACLAQPDVPCKLGATICTAFEQLQKYSAVYTKIEYDDAESECHLKLDARFLPKAGSVSVLDIDAPR